MEREMEMGTEVMEWVGRDLREHSVPPLPYRDKFP